MSTPSQTEAPASPHKEILQAAVAAWAVGASHAPRWKDKTALGAQLRRADQLLESGLLSVRNVSAITHLTVGRLRKRVDADEPRLGGRLAPATLPWLLDLFRAEEARTTHSVSGSSLELTRKIIESGTSPRTIERLTGIPETTVRRWAEMSA